MITIYAPEAQDFSTLGLGALAPYECTVEEQAGGMYELTMTHPMDAEGKWLNIGVGCIVRAPAPVRETPLVESEIVGEGEATEPVTVTRKIYKVQTNTGANLHLRQGPSTSTAILSKYRPGTEVVVLSQANGWGQVIVCSSGATGYMSMQYLVYVRDETETIEGDAPGPERVVYPVQSRMQLFRVFKVERDAAEREVRLEARHIFYDLLGNVVKNEYAPEGEAADAVVEELFERALNAHDFSVHCQTARNVTGEYTRRGLVECLLDPDDGVLPQTGARLVRDNFDVWLLPDATRETGVTIRHGKNLLGATLTTDWDSLVTRIIPVGQDAEGKALLLEGTTYMDSPHIGDYPVICAQAVEYDVKIGQEGVDNAAQARAKLQELAEADFSDNGVDLPTVGLDVDFVALGETEEYRAYADLEAVHLYDTVRVIAKSAGIDAAVRVTGYKWDALGRKYEAVTLGEIADLKTTVYGYELQRGSVKTIKIAPGAVGSAQLRELAVQYAHINTAAVEQLSANSITALKAYIHELVAGSITTDQLYADLAAIALAQITTANIENANIDWAQIGTLSADIATIAKAHLTDADIDWAQIANLTAAVAEIAQVEIGEAVIDGAQITDGTITNAKIENGAIDTAKIALGAITTALIATGAVGTAQIADGSITDAKIVSLNADVINAGTLSVDRLLLKGPDGLFVAINATDEGLTSEQLSQEEYQNAISGSVLVARSVTADKIAAKSITANEIAAGAITTAELAAESVDASKIKAGSITTSHVAANFGETLDISSNKQVEIIAGNVQQAQETADSAQEAAEQAAPYISATPPETAPEAGKLWLDEGVEPSVLRKWRGADVTTEREYTETQVGCGKNLLPPQTPQTRYGVTIAVQADGGVHISGTCTAEADSPVMFTALMGVTLNGQYTFSMGNAQAVGSHLQMRLLESAGVQIDGTLTNIGAALANAHKSFALDNQYVYGWAIRVGGGETYDVTLYPQLEAGSTATAFEAYEDVPSLALDNAQGQVQSVAVEAGCRARQAVNGQRRNLLKNTQAFTGVNGISELTGETYNGFAVRSGSSANISSDFIEFAQWNDAVDAELGKTYTFSFWAKGSGKLYAYFYRGSDNQPIVVTSISSQGESAARADGQIIFTLSEDWERYWVKWTISDTGEMTNPKKTVLLRLYKTDSATASVCGAQLEEGSTATDWTPAPGDYAPITGRESVEIAACGKNLLPPQTPQTKSGVTLTVQEDGGVHLSGTCTAAEGNPITFSVLMGVTLNGQYTFSMGNAQAVGGHLQMRLLESEAAQVSSAATNFSATVANATNTFELDDQYVYGWLIRVGGGETYDVTLYPQLEAGDTATAFESYRSMDGGTVTPTEPIYGLPDAEDTVEVSVDGDVTVTRRTAVLELDGTENWYAGTAANGKNRWELNFTFDAKLPTSAQNAANMICTHYESIPANATYSGQAGISFGTGTKYIGIFDDQFSDVASFKSYLAAQYAAGTPVTIVYELAAPETEALTAISPIVPVPGQLNLATDADALTATIHGSGWETVNDTNDIRAALADVDSDVAGLIAGMGLLEGTVAQLGEQMITPEGVVSIVAASDGYQALVNMANQSADGLELVRVTVSNLNGRVETLEEGVHVEGSNVGLYSSGSPFRMDIDHTGIGITENGQPTITVRESRADIPRITTQTLIMGGFAYRAGENDLYQMIV